MLKEQKIERDDWRLATLGVVAEVKNKVCQAKAVHFSVVCQIAYHLHVQNGRIHIRDGKPSWTGNSSTEGKLVLYESG